MNTTPELVQEWCAEVQYNVTWAHEPPHVQVFDLCMNHVNDTYFEYYDGQTTLFLGNKSFVAQGDKCEEEDWPAGRDPKAYQPLDFMAITPNATKLFVL